MGETFLNRNRNQVDGWQASSPQNKWADLAEQHTASEENTVSSPDEFVRAVEAVMNEGNRTSDTFSSNPNIAPEKAKAFSDYANALGLASEQFKHGSREAMNQSTPTFANNRASLTGSAVNIVRGKEQQTHDQTHDLSSTVALVNN